MGFFAKRWCSRRWHRDRLPVGVEGVFTGKVTRFRHEWQLTTPDGHVRQRGQRRRLARVAVERLKGLFPVYPASKGVESWDLQRAIGFALSVLDDVPDLFRTRCARNGR